MKSFLLLSICLLAHLAQCTHPIHKVMQMLTDMQGKIIGQGASFQKMYAQFSDACEDRSRELHEEIRVAKAEIADLEGTIENEDDQIVSIDTKIQEISTQLSTDESDLKAIGLIREKERKDFDKSQIEMQDMIGALQRAITILERQIKGGTSFLELQSAGDLVKVFGTMVEANALNSADAQTLTSLVQSGSGGEQGDEDKDEEGDEEESLGAPSSDEAYESKSGSIVETLENLLDKAQTELDEERSTESEKNSNYELLKQVLDNRIKMANREMDSSKKSKAEAGENKATAEGDLSVTKADMEQDVKALGGLHHRCLAKAADFQQETKARDEELDALAKAKDVIKGMVKDLDLQQTDEEPGVVASFLQLKSKKRIAGGTPVSVRIVHMLKKRAKELQSTVLVQFVQSLDSAIRSAAVESQNPLASVKQLISDMVKELEKEAGADADRKKYCDKELAYAEEKKRSKEANRDAVATRVDTMSAQAAELREQLADLQKELGEITRSQTTMDRIRKEEKAAFEKDKPEHEAAIQAVQAAKEVLRDYYAKADDKGNDESERESGNIIGMLEMVESDFAKELSNMVSEEEAAQAAYDETTIENQVSKAAKEQDVQFKTSKSKNLAKGSSELGVDEDGMQTEIDAANEYLTRLKAMCIAKAEPYEERRKRREAELASLREALDILFGESSSLQEASAGKRLLRGGVAQKQPEP